MVSVRSLDGLARQQLDSCGPWTVHSVFEHACNLVKSDGELLGIVRASGGNAPATVVLDDGDLIEAFTARVSPGESAVLATDVLHIGWQLTLELAGAQVWIPAAIVRELPAQEVQRRLKLAAEIGVASAPAGGLAPLLPEALSLAGGSADLPTARAGHDLVVQRARTLLAELAAAIRERRWSDTHAPARALSGLGPGLTPAGDDLLAGLALGLRTALGTLPPEFQTALTEAVIDRTTDLAAARVRHAAGGHPDERVHQLLTVLVTAPAPDVLPAAVRSLLEYGHSSGADMLVGLLTGVALGEGAPSPQPPPPCAGQGEGEQTPKT